MSEGLDSVGAGSIEAQVLGMGLDACTSTSTSTSTSSRSLDPVP
jgi:hypothetical protein